MNEQRRWSSLMLLGHRKNGMRSVDKKNGRRRPCVVWRNVRILQSTALEGLDQTCLKSWKRQ